MERLKRSNSTNAYGYAFGFSPEGDPASCELEPRGQGRPHELTPLVYEDLRQLAHRHMRGQRRDHTLQTTALVHEAYLRLADQTNPNWQTRAHFFAVAARAMRQILVDYARSYRSQKRGDGGLKIELDEAALVSPEESKNH